MLSAWSRPSRWKGSTSPAPIPARLLAHRATHHVMEYPWAAKALSERIGTALINGNWFIRSLQKMAGRAVLMHGHRHVDWIGECAGLPVVSAPSPVMEVTDEKDTAF